MEDNWDSHSEEYKNKFRELFLKKLLPAASIGFTFWYPGAQDDINTLRIEAINEMRILYPNDNSSQFVSH